MAKKFCVFAQRLGKVQSGVFLVEVNQLCLFVIEGVQGWFCGLLF